MNRLLIFGNGFDLANGLETSYKQFLKSYIFKNLHFFTSKVYNEKEELIKFSLSDDKSAINYNKVGIPQGYHNPEKVFEVIELIDEKDKYFNHIKIESSPFFRRICNTAIKKWVDIEEEYFTYLTELYNTKATDGISDLNKDFNLLKQRLKEYLKSQQEKYDKSPFTAESSLASKQFSYSIETKDVCYLNFNYTEPNFNITSEKTKIINLHGTLKSDIIFGYGDEETDIYNELMEDGNDVLIENLKLQLYPNTDEYTDLHTFLNTRSYEVFIIGHSCGKSDRTILKEIFNHRNCKKIQLFYYVESEIKDNFQELYNSISRIITDSSKRRSIVSTKPKSFNINEIINIAGGI